MTDIAMPRLSDSMEEGTILTWLKATGERVAKDEELVEIETDKATMTYESPEAGVVTLVAEPGATLPVGAIIATVGESSEAPAPEAERPAAPPSEPEVNAQPTIAQEVRVAPAPASAEAPAANRSVRATPVARRLAKVHGVDLLTVQGSGPHGRVVRRDVAVVAGIDLAPEPSSVPPPAAAASTSSRGTEGISSAKGEVTVVELTKLQQVVARRMAEAKATVPEFQVQTEVAMDAALALRAQLKGLGGEVVPSVNDLIVKAAALALRQWPQANGAYRDGKFELYSRVNVGVAVAAQDALVVPTITDADTRSLGSIAAETRRLAERVRSGTITPPELSGATFTVSNLGMYGMTAITPVINSPQAAILGVGASRPVPALVDGQLVEHQRMIITLTCDHRILYGADAAQFLAAIRRYLEQPLGLAL
jgi:pyruvate dehydrogenase E2 component (dihydrolipoamide acetyltransferase)